jgi:hypothetical protein
MNFASPLEKKLRTKSKRNDLKLSKPALQMKCLHSSDDTEEKQNDVRD